MTPDPVHGSRLVFCMPNHRLGWIALCIALVPFFLYRNADAARHGKNKRGRVVVPPSNSVGAGEQNVPERTRESEEVVHGSFLEILQMLGPLCSRNANECPEEAKDAREPAMYRPGAPSDIHPENIPRLTFFSNVKALFDVATRYNAFRTPIQISQSSSIPVESGSFNRIDQSCATEITNTTDLAAPDRGFLSIGEICSIWDSLTDQIEQFAYTLDSRESLESELVPHSKIALELFIQNPDVAIRTASPDDLFGLAYHVETRRTFFRHMERLDWDLLAEFSNKLTAHQLFISDKMNGCMKKESPKLFLVFITFMGLKFAERCTTDMSLMFSSVEQIPLSSMGSPEYENAQEPEDFQLIRAFRHIMMDKEIGYDLFKAIFRVVRRMSANQIKYLQKVLHLSQLALYKRSDLDGYGIDNDSLRIFEEEWTKRVVNGEYSSAIGGLREGTYGSISGGLHEGRMVLRRNENIYLMYGDGLVGTVYVKICRMVYGSLLSKFVKHQNDILKSMEGASRRYISNLDREEEQLVYWRMYQYLKLVHINHVVFNLAKAFIFFMNGRLDKWSLTHALFDSASNFAREIALHSSPVDDYFVEHVDSRIGVDRENGAVRHRFDKVSQVKQGPATVPKELEFITASLQASLECLFAMAYVISESSEFGYAFNGRTTIRLQGHIVSDCLPNVDPDLYDVSRLLMLKVMKDNLTISEDTTLLGIMTRLTRIRLAVGNRETPIAFGRTQTSIERYTNEHATLSTRRKTPTRCPTCTDDSKLNSDECVLTRAEIPELGLLSEEKETLAVAEPVGPAVEDNDPEKSAQKLTKAEKNLRRKAAKATKAREAEAKNKAMEDEEGNAAEERGRYIMDPTCTSEWEGRFIGEEDGRIFDNHPLESRGHHVFVHMLDDRLYLSKMSMLTLYRIFEYDGAVGFNSTDDLRPVIELYREIATRGFGQVEEVRNGHKLKLAKEGKFVPQVTIHTVHKSTRYNSIKYIRQRFEWAQIHPRFFQAK